MCQAEVHLHCAVVANSRSVHEARCGRACSGFQQCCRTRTSSRWLRRSHLPDMQHSAMPTFGVNVWRDAADGLWRRAGTWPECCGFVVLLDSQSQRSVMHHGSINVVLASVGLRATDQTWNYEQWPLKHAGRKRRRDVTRHLCCHLVRTC